MLRGPSPPRPTAASTEPAAPRRGSIYTPAVTTDAWGKNPVSKQFQVPLCPTPCPCHRRDSREDGVLTERSSPASHTQLHGFSVLPELCKQCTNSRTLSSPRKDPVPISCHSPSPGKHESTFCLCGLACFCTFHVNGITQCVAFCTFSRQMKSQPSSVLNNTLQPMRDQMTRIPRSPVTRMWRRWGREGRQAAQRPQPRGT